MATCSTWDTASKYVNVTQQFGATSYDPKHRGVDWNTKKNGVDTDLNVRAIGNGTVLRSEWTPSGASWTWGNHVAIYYPAINKTILSAHLAERKVQVGDSVTYGTIIGIMGQTGQATGIHVHEETHVGKGITNNLIAPVSGIPNAVGLYDNTYPGSEPEPPIPPAEGNINLRMIEFVESGHHITAPCSNDPDGYIYFNNNRFFRTHYPEMKQVEEYSPEWGYWMNITDVLIVRTISKDLTGLPDI